MRGQNVLLLLQNISRKVCFWNYVFQKCRRKSLVNVSKSKVLRKALHHFQNFVSKVLIQNQKCSRKVLLKLCLKNVWPTFSLQNTPCLESKKVCFWNYVFEKVSHQIQSATLRKSWFETKTSRQANFSRKVLLLCFQEVVFLWVCTKKHGIAVPSTPPKTLPCVQLPWRTPGHGVCVQFIYTRVRTHRHLTPLFRGFTHESYHHEKSWQKKRSHVCSQHVLQVTVCAYNLYIQEYVYTVTWCKLKRNLAHFLENSLPWKPRVTMFYSYAEFSETTLWEN